MTNSHTSICQFYNYLCPQVLDGSTTDSRTNICTRALLHSRHNPEPFSKFAFLAGQYKNWDMATLDITRWEA